jgi:hypothetical protein
MSDTEQYFVHTGLSRGEYYGTYIRKPNGSLKRVVSKALPLRHFREDAESDLRVWLEKKG